MKVVEKKKRRVKKKKSEDASVLNVRGSTRACWHHPYHERVRKTPSPLLVERMKKTLHTYSLNSYIHTYTCMREKNATEEKL